MANIAPSKVELPSIVDGKIAIHVITWANMANGDIGLPYALPEWADRNVQVAGTPGAGGNARIEGSNEGNPAAQPQSLPTDYATLNDASGTALNFTAAGLKEISECPLWIRPNITAGDGTTSLTVILVVRRTR